MKPLNVLFYYGYPNSFNSSANGWVNEKVAQDMAQYSMIVLGDGVQDPGHADYANTQVIIPRIYELNPGCKIYGYVSTKQQGSARAGGYDENLDFGDFCYKARRWDDLEVDGIFFDESGYDYGKKRKDFNDRVRFVHGLGYAKVCFINAWNPKHVLGTENDASYPNSTYNPDELESELNNCDWYLLESFSYGPFGGGGALQYEAAAQWKSRLEAIAEVVAEDPINVATLCQIDDADVNGQAKFDFTYVASIMADADAHGSSNTLHGASSAAVKMWTRPDVEGIMEHNEVYDVQSDANKYFRYSTHGKFELDFTASSETSTITKY